MVFVDPSESLCSRVLKGNYFPATYFLHAMVPARASATWRAIVARREALNVGLIHRVGDKSTIETWTDSGIPNTTTLKPMGRLGVAHFTRVSELIDECTGNWYVQIIRHNFLQLDVEAILNIPLNPAGGNDTLAWALEKSGIYTMTSVCCSLVTRNEHRALEEGTVMETSSANKQLWNALWKLNVVPKV